MPIFPVTLFSMKKISFCVDADDSHKDHLSAAAVTVSLDAEEAPGNDVLEE
jgi:hypothetical protein